MIEIFIGSLGLLFCIIGFLVIAYIFKLLSGDMNFLLASFCAVIFLFGILFVNVGGEILTEYSNQNQTQYNETEVLNETEALNLTESWECIEKQVDKLVVKCEGFEYEVSILDSDDNAEEICARWNRTVESWYAIEHCTKYMKVGVRVQ